MTKRRFLIFLTLAVAVLALPWGIGQAQATNYANSPIITKFTDPLPAIPIATPTTPPPPGVPADGDYYEINAVQTTWQFSSTLPGPSKVRGYMQNGGTYQYLGPMIVAQQGKPVRLKFTNQLPNDTSTTTTEGNLFLPVDTNLMGAGMGPLGMLGTNYPQNRTTLHLHGGDTPWISDGTTHQWITPAGEAYSYTRGVSQQNVPDMPVPPAGSETLYYPNGLSGRLMWYHDHAFGITRLNVYAGLAAPYLLHDANEDKLIGPTIPTGGTLPGGQGTQFGIPLVIQDKSFVDTAANMLGTTAAPGKDPTWATIATWPGGTNPGDLWFPHVYEFNQSGTFASMAGVNPQGRWDYGPFVWPPATIADTASGFGNSMGMPLPAAIGDVRDPSCVPEAFMDTMVVNGAAYPKITVGQKSYRFRILNACNDRMLNLQLYYAANNGPFPAPSSTGVAGTNLMGSPPYAANITDANTLTGTDAQGNPIAGKEVSMVKADGSIYGLTAVGPYNPVQYPGLMQSESGVNTPLFYVLPALVNTVNGTINAGTASVAVPFDGRVGGVPDPRQMGPQMIQIGSEGGLLPTPIVLANNCVDYDYNRKNITLGNVRNFALQTPNPSNPGQTLNYPHPGYNLHLGPAVRADVVIDFSTVPDGSTLILYNDCPAPQPGFDPRYDYYTNDPDYSNSLTGLNMGGAPSTLPGQGPNTRTVMQITVSAAADTGNTAPTGATLLSGLQAALPGYFGTYQPTFVIPPGSYAPVQNITGMTGTNGTEIPILNKSIAEDFDPVWGRMNAMLGTEQASTNTQGQQTFGFHFADTITENINPFNIPNFPPNTIATPVSDATTYGTQIWKITHNGVDTHAIHFHLFNVQLVNRVDWAGVIKPPDPNESGWNETLRLNPLEDIYVALRPKIPTLAPTMPPLPNNVRYLDPTMPPGMTDALFWNKLPAGAVIPSFPFSNPGPNLVTPAVGLTITNNLTDFGWEYVWHCHLLGHEENDMMRPISFQVAPKAPTLLVSKNKGSSVNNSWTNNETIQTNFTFVLQRATDAAFTQNVTPLPPAVGALTLSSGNTNLATYSLPNTLPGKGTYFYRVRAQNNIGASAWSNVTSVKW